MTRSLLRNWGRFIGLGIVLIASVMLSACGGGGGGSSATASADPTGYYDATGTASVADGSGGTMNITDLEAMVSNSHMMMMSSNNSLLYDVNITNISGNNFTGSVKIFYISGSSQLNSTTTISGTITQGSSITGTIAGTGVGSGTFNLVYNNQSVKLPSTATEWGYHIGGATAYFIITISNVATLTTTASVTDGYFSSCTMSGNVSSLGGGDLYSVSVTVSGCQNTSIDGNYSGFTAPQDATNTVIAFAITKSDSSYAVSGDFSQ